MSYISQTEKKRIVALCKPILAKYGVRATFSVSSGYHCLVAKIKTGDLFPEKVYVNHYFVSDHFEGDQRGFLRELITAMNSGNWNNSDVQSDYFDVGWYIRILVTD